MSTIIQYKHESDLNNSLKHEPENTGSSRITALDMVGLTWIFKKDQDLLEEFK
jgi:hypothetical protein